MLRATSSPLRPPPRSSVVAQRLHEAAELDNEHDEIERGRAELERVRSQRKPPPPPPVSPRTRALNRVLDIVETDLKTSGELDDNAVDIAVQSLRAAVRQVLNEHIEAALPPSTPSAANLPLVPATVLRRRASDEDANEAEGRQQLFFRQNFDGSRPTQLVLKKHAPLPLQGRLWNIMITSAALQFNKAVEYEVRSELSFVGESSSATGSCVVRRRYRDFDRMSKMLADTEPDQFVMIPNLPPKDAKSVVTGSRADPQFVWERRVALFFWLRYVSSHHVLRNSTLLRVFLWEPNRASTSNGNTNGMVGEMNPAAEKMLWERAMEHQQSLMEYRFGNSVVALTSMATYLKMMTQAYQKAARKVTAVVKADESLGRSLGRASKAFREWAEFEKGAGLNYGFVSRFSEALPARDTSKPAFVVQPKGPNGDNATGTSSEEALVSFGEKASIPLMSHYASSNNHPQPSSKESMDRILVKDQVEVPEIPGAFCDVRSLKAFGTLLKMWGDDILVRMGSSMVDPKKASPYYEETKSAADMFSTRVACEWTELEILKRDMLSDGVVHLVLDQIRHAQAETRRWQQIQEQIRVQEVELSSLVALGDVTSPPVSSPAMHHSQSSISSSSSEASSHLDHHTLRQVSSSGFGKPVGGRPSDLSEQSQASPTIDALDEDLDVVQARFQQHHSMGGDQVNLDLSPSLRFNELEDSRYLNPFVSDEED